MPCFYVIFLNSQNSYHQFCTIFKTNLNNLKIRYVFLNKNCLYITLKKRVVNLRKTWYFLIQSRVPERNKGMIFVGC